MLISILKKYKKFADIYLISGQVAKVKVNGKIIDVELGVDEDGNNKKFIVTDKVIEKFVISKHKDSVSIRQTLEKEIGPENTGEKDFSISIEDYGFRVNLFRTSKGLSSVLRLIPNVIPQFDELGLPRHLLDTAKYKTGLVLVTGVTGSGKSTTLASILNHINTNYSKHVLTIEDPIEFRYVPIKSIMTQREVGTNTVSFGHGLRAALREAPDVILVGEMRDRETIETAIKAAETGHLVLSTLHTFSAVQTIERILGAFDGNDKEIIKNSLANVLKVIVSQKLVLTLNKELEIVYEIVYNDLSIANNIREGKITQMKNTAQNGDNRDKNIFLNQVLRQKFDQGKLTMEDALEYSYDPKELEIMISENQ